jgi:hypothetical protein
MKAVPVAVRASELAAVSLPKSAQVVASSSKGIQEVVGEVGVVSKGEDGCRRAAAASLALDECSISCSPVQVAKGDPISGALTAMKRAFCWSSTVVNPFSRKRVIPNNNRTSVRS